MSSLVNAQPANPFSQLPPLTSGQFIAAAVASNAAAQHYQALLRNSDTAVYATVLPNVDDVNDQPIEHDELASFIIDLCIGGITDLGIPALKALGKGTIGLTDRAVFTSTVKSIAAWTVQQPNVTFGSPGEPPRPASQNKEDLDAGISLPGGIAPSTASGNPASDAPTGAGQTAGGHLDPTRPSGLIDGDADGLAGPPQTMGGSVEPAGPPGFDVPDAGVFGGSAGEDATPEIPSDAGAGDLSLPGGVPGEAAGTAASDDSVTLAVPGGGEGSGTDAGGGGGGGGGGGLGDGGFDHEMSAQ